MAGVFFDELKEGQLFKHESRRTITEADNVWFSAITHGPTYLNLDEEYCRTETEFGQRPVNSAFTLALIASRLARRHLIEIGVLRSQCLDRRIGDRKTLDAEIAAWQDSATPTSKLLVGDISFSGAREGRPHPRAS